jgi:thioredoxin reductase (NADPH)
LSELIVVGNGPAGISAALYAVRAGIQTTVIGKDGGALSKAGQVENYYGFEEPVSGRHLIDTGILQAKRLGVEILEDEVVGIGYENGFTVKTTLGEYTAKSVILATGAGRAVPKMEGFEQYDGKGISYCAVCDAFFHRGKEVAVLGSGEYALSEAEELLPIAKSVTILTNGETLSAKVPAEFKVITKKIEAITGGEVLNGVRFQDGTNLAVSGIFVAIGVAGSSDLARKLGAQVNGKKIVVSEAMETGIPGLFAAGDCTGGLLQIAKAVYQGAVAGTEAVKFVRRSK